MSQKKYYRDGQAGIRIFLLTRGTIPKGMGILMYIGIDALVDRAGSVEEEKKIRGSEGLRGGKKKSKRAEPSIVT